jgi:hypothetical protein
LIKAAKKVQAALMVGKNVLLGGNLAALTMVAKPRELVRYVGESLLLYRSIASKRGIPQKNVYEVLKSEGSVEQILLGNLSDGGSWFTPVPSYAIDIVSLCLICRLLRPKKVFEIGTLTGYTSFHFALNTPEDAHVFTLDLPKSIRTEPQLKTDYADDTGIERHAKAQCYCFENTPPASKITMLVGDSAGFDFTPYHGQVDFFFIDGAHSYEYVRSDTLNALKCCHAGSVIAWHDFGRVVVDGVAKWVTEFARNHEVYSVPGGSLAFTVLK